MTYTDIAYESLDHVRIIRFDRPEVRNCIRQRTHEELVDAWSRFKDDDDAYVAIVTGSGDKSFCAGGDLKSAELFERLGGVPNFCDRKVKSFRSSTDCAPIRY